MAAEAFFHYNSRKGYFCSLNSNATLICPKMSQSDRMHILNKAKKISIYYNVRCYSQCSYEVIKQITFILAEQCRTHGPLVPQFWDNAAAQWSDFLWPNGEKSPAGLNWPRSITWPQSNWACVLFTEDQMERRRRSEAGCSLGLAAHQALNTVSCILPKHKSGNNQSICKRD